jgi:hypothetical protein
MIVFRIAFARIVQVLFACRRMTESASLFGGLAVLGLGVGIHRETQTADDQGRGYRYFKD